MQDAVWSVASHTGGESLRKATRQYNRAHLSQWPAWIACVETGTASPRYAAIRALVLHELRDPGNCPACGGRGNTTRGQLVTTCTDCRGTGRGRDSDRCRAKALKMGPKTYADNWRDVYAWTMTQCSRALDRARQQMLDGVL